MIDLIVKIVLLFFIFGAGMHSQLHKYFDNTTDRWLRFFLNFIAAAGMAAIILLLK